MNLFSEDVWNGNATTIRRGEFDTEGLFAASNSFPLNSKISVTNLQNGKTSTVIIRKRIPDSSNMFILLSDDAANDLGMGTYDVVNVEVRVISYGVDEIIGLPDDLPYNPDPDFWMGTPGPRYIGTPIPVPEEMFTPSPAPFIEPTPGVTIAPTIEPTPGVTAESEVETTPEPTIEETPAPTPEPESTPESIGRIPEKNLYLLPHEDERFMALDYMKSSKKDTGDASKNLSLNEANVKLKEQEKPVEGGIVSPTKITEKGVVYSADLNTPSVETPQVIDIPAYTAEEVGSEHVAALPPVQKKESLVPDYSAEGLILEESVIALEPTEPLTPSTKIASAEVSDEYPRIAEAETSLFPGEPLVVVNKDNGEIAESASRIAEQEIALEPDEPRIESKKKDVATPTDVTPKIKEGESKHIAVEPSIHDKTTDTQKEPTNGTGQLSMETEITLVPTDLRPPVKTDGTGYSTEASVLPKNNYFVQIGSFTDKSIALSVKDRYDDTYPVLIYSPETSKLKIYNVLIGPLNKPESDTLFYRFRSNGIKDVFVKFIQ